MRQFIKESLLDALFYLKRTFMWLGIAVLVGLLCGVIGTLFYHAVHKANELLAAYRFTLYLLPLAGLLIALLYRKTGMEGEGTNNIINSIQFGEKVPLMLTPVIFAGTFLTHLCGGSAGREGAALQIGGSLGFRVGTLLKLDEKDMRLVTLSGMSALFSALFGTPLTAAVFSLEVISVGIVHYSGFLPCIVSAIVAFGVSQYFGCGATRFLMLPRALETFMLLRVALLAVLCAGISIVFCLAIHETTVLAEEKFKSPYLRAAVGGCLIIALTLLVGTRNYNGAGGSVIAAAIAGEHVDSFAFLWKIIFTAVTIGFGFKGGEIVPTFFVGATFGAVVGPLLGIPAELAAAAALVAVFCGNVNCPVASIILSAELFGSGNIVYYALAACIAYILSGYFGLYRSQKIVYSKTRAEYININVR